MRGIVPHARRLAGLRSRCRWAVLRCVTEGTSPMGIIKLNREQREAIYAEVALDLDAVGDLAIVMSKGDYDTARRYRRRFEDDMRLLDDLGWEPEQNRDEFELTMPTADLARVSGATSTGCSALRYRPTSPSPRRLVGTPPSRSPRRRHSPASSPKLRSQIVQARAP